MSIDQNYQRKNLKIILRDLDQYSGEELSRSLLRLAKVAEHKVFSEEEFTTKTSIKITQLEQEVKELKAKLERDRLIHVGYTNGSQLCHAKVENGGEGAFYSDTEGNCFIPLYMLACHLHRLDGTLSEPWANEQLQEQE